MFVVSLHTPSLLISASLLHCCYFFCGACHRCSLLFTASPATTCCRHCFSSRCHVCHLSGRHFYRDRCPALVLFLRALLHPPFQMGLKHVLVLPFPAQGHVNPLIHLSHKLVQHGCKVTFVNTEFNHKRVFNAMNGKELGPEDDRSDVAGLIASMVRTMPSYLEMLIRVINSRDGGSNRIISIVCDTYMAWGLEIAQKLAIKN
ncbi:hypothetical protein HN51_047770 [Arachis hypogaea]